MKYVNKLGCSGCNIPECVVCYPSKTCPQCGQARLPIGKHNKCAVCGYQLDCVTYDKVTYDHGPSDSKGFVDEWVKHPDAHLSDFDSKDGDKVFSCL